MTTTLDLTKELISRASVTPEDKGCQELMAERLAALGFLIEDMPFGEVQNLWARRGTEGPVLCFAGHTDVVPAGPLDQWDTEPFSPEIRDGVLYGRGAADMKASLAAMVVATEEFVARHPRHAGSLAFLITSDEEGRARDGTKKVIEALSERGERIDWCVIGEPSCHAEFGDVIRIGRRGSLSGMLTVHGQQGHVAYPQLADNPIQKFAPVLAELFAQTLDEGNEFFPPTSFQVVKLESDAGAPNVIPGSLHARFNFRYSTVWTYGKLQQFIEQFFDGHGLSYTLEWHLSGEPFLTPMDKLAEASRAAVLEVTGVEPEFSTGGGTSDGRFIAPSGAHVIEFGPINATIHKVNEQVAVADIDRLRQVYLSIMEKMLLTD
ncbi:MAG: succinyl-diaminopimelate desuccinylase [Gammaproteobacteria bacterium]|nr:succinyl-diaminopimelate desuccinylase [Gammaproteobacteria bacterium]NND35624.1 succinyl-diaminopimelate desuccinylase [Gammaproteobacteria bacterium]